MRWLALLLLALQDCDCAALPRDRRQIIRSRIVHSEQEVENIDREYLSYLQECFVFLTSWLMSHSNGFIPILYQGGKTYKGVDWTPKFEFYLYNDV